jgi:tRNA uridine 5-carboxymethylaminomethyl modification enzyme
VVEKRNGVAALQKLLNQVSVEPSQVNAYLESINSAVITEKQKASKVLLRPDVDLVSLSTYIPALKDALTAYTAETIEQAEIQIKYERYIEKEQDIVTRMSQMEELVIPDSFDYDKITSLSNEALQKFKKIRPQTLGQASRISGVNPSDVQILMVYMGR